MVWHSMRPNIFCPNSDTLPQTETMFCRPFGGLDVMVAFHDQSVFNLTDQPHEADIVAFGYHGDYDDTGHVDVQRFIRQFPNVKLFVDMINLMHIGEGVSNYNVLRNNSTMLKQMFGDTRLLYLHTNHANHGQEDLAYLRYTDYLWNRHTLFYTDHDNRVFDATSSDIMNHWYPTLAVDSQGREYMDKTMYELSDIDYAVNGPHADMILNNDSVLVKSFLSLNSTRNSVGLRSEYTAFQMAENPVHQSHPRDFFRVELIKLLSGYPGYLSDPGRGTFLVGQGESIHQHITPQIMGYGNLGWTPAHNAYYDNTAVSIYVETLLNGGNQDQEVVRSITEKTWEPLIKGHFILPFGTHQLVADLQKEYGFKMAPFIDYTYDQLEDGLQRWTAYVIEVKRLLSLGGKELFRLKQQHADILQHNRNIMAQGYRHTVGKAIHDYCRDSEQTLLFPEEFMNVPHK